MKKTLMTAISVMLVASVYADYANINPVPYPPLNASGSDARAAAFNAALLPGWAAMVLPDGGYGSLPLNAALPQYNVFNQQGITLGSDFYARAYFIEESAGYHNTLRYTADGTGMPDGSGAIYDFTLPNSFLSGDFVNLGSYTAGTPLDFFIIANGANFNLPGPGKVYSTVSSANDPDQNIDHVLQYATANIGASTYYLFAFEDKPFSARGGAKADGDFNDVVFAVELTRVPEPATIAILGSFLALAFWIKRRQTA